MNNGGVWAKVPGIVAVALMTVTASLWTLWSLGEFFFEGWGLAFPSPLAYLVPGAAFMLLSLIVLTWPRFGGVLLAAAALVFTCWALGLNIRRWGFSWTMVLSWFPASAMAVLTGVLFYLDGRRRRLESRAGRMPQGSWLRRNLRFVVGLGIPAAVAVVLTAASLPELLGRVDDGDRGARLIEGNGVRLIWAPAGPGWNWKQPWGGYPSWNELARYGAPPVGLGKKPGPERDAGRTEMDSTCLCRYLSADGLSLVPEPQNVWRMPTTDELVRSLLRRGKNAGGEWNRSPGPGDFRIRPDKETPLWAPDQPPVYYWSADEFDERNAWYVSYRGYVLKQPKDYGNPRHGYRCVREP